MNWTPIRKVHFVRAACICVIFGGAALGVVLKPLSLSQMLDRATNVSISEVSEISSFWQSGRILTWVTAIPSKTFKGSHATLRILVPGGTVGNLTQHIPGGPKFTLGQTNLLFLEPMDTLDGFRLVGFTQGKVVRDDSDSNTLFRRWVNELKSMGKPTSSSPDLQSVQGEP